MYPDRAAAESPANSYRRLADVFHALLSEQTLDTLLETIADTLADLVPYEALHIYECDEARGELVPVFLRSEWAEEIFASRPQFGQGITGWSVVHREPVLTNQAHLDPRVFQVPGTPVEPEALITVPLIARENLKGALNIYRIGDDAAFDEEEFELAKRFGDAAALALDNAHIRARLEHQAQTDSLTSAYNHRHYHERLRAELTRASRAGESVAVLMFDIDDFKKVNDVYGHGEGDRLLIGLAELTRRAVRGYDVVCRVGGDEFAVIMPSCDADAALGLARRLVDEVAATDFGPAGSVRLSVGLAQGPEHAMSPRELTACAEMAMMAAKARGGDGVAVFSADTVERPETAPGVRDGRSLAHLKVLQGVTAALSRLTDVHAIGEAVADELRTLIDYHNCRVFLVEGATLRPIAFRGRFASDGDVEPARLIGRVGEGITGRVAETGEPLLVDNVLECEFAIQIPGTPTIVESMLAVPMLYGGRTVGVVVVSKLGLAQFDVDDLRLLEVLAGHAAIALENAALYDGQRREAERANILLEFGRGLARVESVDAAAQLVVDLSGRLLGAFEASLWLQESAGGELVALASWGEETESRGLSGRYSASVATELLATTEPFVLTVDHVGTLTGEPSQQDQAVYVLAPLQLEDRVGCLAVGLRSTTPSELSEHTRRLLAGLADQAKLALASARSYESLERMFISTMESLANALEASDEYTSSHARWIRDAALAVGRRLGLDPVSMKRLEYASLFHDIGMIGIPTDVLRKPGPLTPEERALVEMHPELGERILEPIERLGDVRPIVRRCHERWDGAGYPDGLSGEDIPLEARIVFVCDAFHAMVSDRPYRPRLSVEEACERLVDAAGTQFDPRVVTAFVEAGIADGLETVAA